MKQKESNAERLAGAGVPIDACLERIAARVVEGATANCRSAAEELNILADKLREVVLNMSKAGLDRLTVVEGGKRATPPSSRRRRNAREVDLAAYRLEDFVAHGRGVDAESEEWIRDQHPLADLGPYTDFEWGMLSGKLSALRWVQGFDWDMLDT